MVEAAGDRRIHMRSGIWVWEEADPAPDLELNEPHLRLTDPDESGNEMRVFVEGDPNDLSEDAMERAAARPAMRMWLDRQGVFWVVWPPEDAPGAPRTLLFDSEEISYETPAPRPLGELKDIELQELLDTEREAEAGVEEEWIGGEW